MIPRTYPGIPSFNVKVGYTVQAAHCQALLDWFRWFFFYFCPPHMYLAIDDGLNGCVSSQATGRVSSLSAPPYQPTSWLDLISSLSDGASITYGGNTYTVNEGCTVLEGGGNPLTATSIKGGAIFVERWGDVP